MNSVTRLLPSIGFIGKLLVAAICLAVPAFAAPARAADNPPGSITYEPKDGPGKGKHVVLISGDEEYRSEEGLPMLAKLLSQRHGFKCTVLFAMDPDGTIDPDNQASLPGAEALDSADAIVIQTRFRHWPDDQMKHFVDAYRRGVPVVGMRTATHAFSGIQGQYKDFNNFGKRVLGEQWVSHWGNHKKEATKGIIEPGAANDPVLRGVSDVFGTTDVYEAYPPADAKILLRGQVLKGMEPNDVPADYKKKRSTDKQEQGVNDPMMAVAWTRVYKNEAGKENKTLCTTMGAATDLLNEGLRRMIVNAVYWGLGMEVPAKADVEIVDPYKPDMYGFAGYRVGLKPDDFALGKTLPDLPIKSQVKDNNKEKKASAEKKPGKSAAGGPKDPGAKAVVEVVRDTDTKVLAAGSAPSGGAHPAAAAANANGNADGVHLQNSGGPLHLNKDEHVVLLGNAVADRMQHDGYLEALVYAGDPTDDLVFRNLAVTGDEVNTWHRSENFGSRDDWLKRSGADVVFAFYGFNESFKGKDGLPAFKAAVEKFLADTQAQDYGSHGPCKVVLFSPIANEKLPDPNYGDPAARNADLAAYAAAMAEAAKAHGVQFVDLYTPTEKLFADAAKQGKPLTLDGMHLTQEGDKLLAPVIYQALFGQPAPTAVPGNAGGDLEKLRQAILDKNEQWHHRYRTVDGYNVYGGRSAEAYRPGTGAMMTNRQPPAPFVSNYQVMQQEMTQRDVLTANRDKRVWALAQGKDLAVQDNDLPPVQKVETNHPGPNPDKSWPFPEAQAAISKMTVAQGCKVNVFASEEEYPDLINPVQMAWDTKGRLWVAAWRNYPERTPTSTVGDSILIFEDTKGTGHADKVTHFIDGLNCPTGFQFYKDGILLMQAPDLWYVHTGPDGKAGKVERVLMGMDSADSHHTTNSMVLEPGGATYLSDGVFHRTQVETAYGPVRNEDACIYRYEPNTGRFERYAPYGFANPHGRVFDAWGNDLITDATGNNTFFGPAISGHIDYPAKHPSIRQFWERPSRPCPGTGIMTSKHFPEEYWGNFLNCNVIGFQGIYRVKVDEDGSGLKGASLPDLISSPDPTFRPTGVNVGPDGALYFMDWSNSIIGHLQHHLRDPNRDHQHGRIYRITYEGRPLVHQPKIDGQSVPALLDLLKAPEDQVRTLAKIELGKHDSAEVMAALKSWVAALDKNDPANAHELTEALWVHQWHNVADAEGLDLLKQLLRSPDSHARAAATRVLCYWRDRVPDALALLKVQAGDESPRVRLEAVRAASFSQSPQAVEVALESLKHPSDYYLDYVLKETMRQLEPLARQQLADGKLPAADNPAGVDYLVHSVSTNDLLKLPHSPEVLQAILARPELTDVVRLQTLNELAEQKKTKGVSVVLSLIDAARNSAGDTSKLAILARLLPGQLPADLKPVRDRLFDLALHGPSADVRQPAWAAVATADLSFEPAWKEASKSLSELTDLVSAVPLIFKQDVRVEAYDKVKPLLSPELPADLSAAAKSQPVVNGRYVRIELPRRGTLTLAEVQVFSGGRNVALGGKATQSSVAYGGEASHAIDGRTDGSYGSGTQTHTEENERHPWWEVDLGSEQPINSVVVWNRTDGNGEYAGRLKDFTLLILDHNRGEVFKSANNPAPPESARMEVGHDGLAGLRQAAIRAAVSIDQDRPATFAALVNLIRKGEQVPAAAEGIRALPRTAWTPGPAGEAAEALVSWAKAIPASDRTTPDYVATVQTAGDLAGLMPAEQAGKLRKELKGLRVSVFVVNTVREQMRYDTPRLVVEAGKPFEVIFQNGDFMPHNFVVVKPGARPKVGAESATMRPDQLDRMGRAFIPIDPDILAGTKLLEPGQRVTLKLTAPAKEGDYEYVCTYPGHWELMWGTLVVTKDVDGYLQQHPSAAPAGAGGKHQHAE